MYEVLDASINIHLNDRDAILGVERLRTTVKRNVKAIARERAVVHIEGDLKKLKKDLKEANGLIEAQSEKVADLEAKRARTSGAAKKAVDKRLKAEREVLNTLKSQQTLPDAEVNRLQDRVDSYKRLNREEKYKNRQLLEEQKLQDGITKALKQQLDAMQKEGRMHARALADDQKRSENLQKEAQARGKMHAQALKMDAERTRSMQEYEQKQGALQARAQREMEADFAARARLRDKEETDRRKMNLEHAKALKEDIGRESKILQLQQKFTEEYRKVQKIDQERKRFGGHRGRLARAGDPEITEKVNLDRKTALAQMAILKAELEAMGAEPVDIRTRVTGDKNLFQKIGGLGDIGTRIGPFAGPLSKFAKALLYLGPILTGVIGYLGALTGAVGAGLVGALGLGGAALGAFGLSLGGVGLLTASLMRDFKNLNTLQDAYHKQVLKTGAGSDKAKTKLAEFNHALGAVTPTTREAFLSLDKLQSRWRGLRKDVKPDFMNALGSGIKTVNVLWGTFADHTKEAFREVSHGFQDWMKGLRSAGGQKVISQLMDNANASIPPLMHGLGQLAAAMGKVSASFSRHLPALFDRFDKWATNLNKATNNTDGLNRGVSRMVKSFYDVWHVLTGAGRVLKEFMLTAMGPGGKAVGDLAAGLNGLADSMAADRAGNNKLGKFLKESVQTTDELYHAVQPLLKLFIEFSTIMRPFTDQALKLAGAIAKITANLAGLPGIHQALQVMAGLWLFKKVFWNTAANGVSIVNAMARALLGLSAAGKGGALARIAGSLGGIMGRGKLGRGKELTTGFSGTLGNTAGEGAGTQLLRKLGKGSVLRGGVVGGLAAGTVFVGQAWAKGIVQGFKTHNWGKALEDVRHEVTLGLWPKGKDYTEIDKNITNDIDRINALAQQHARAKKLGVDLEINFKTDKFDQNMDVVISSLERMRDTTVTTIGQARSSLQQHLELMSRSINIHSANGKRQVAGAYRSMADSIKRGMNRGLIDTQKGTAEIHRLLLKALAALGIQGRANQEGYLATQEDRKAHPHRTTSGQRNAANQAATGWIGSPTQHGPDVIPLMVGAGEAVLNRHQQVYVNAGLQAIGMDNGLSDLFSRVRTPHYMARGGVATAATGKPPTLPRYISRTSGVWGQAVQGGLDKYRDMAQRKQDSAWQASMGPGGGFMGGARGSVRAGMALARALGLTITSTTGGKHAAGSWHYKGRAIDVAGSAEQMMHFFRAAAAKYGKNILELFYDPAGWYIKNGHKVGGAIGGHSDHVHLAMARGGFVGKAAKGRSPLSKIMSNVLSKAPGLSAFNHMYKKGSKETLDPMVIRAIAEAVGYSPTEALHMMQISKGESTFQPGAVSKDGGIGLMQNTPRVWGAKAKKFMAQLGGENALLNPIISMAMAKYLSDDRRRQGKDPLGPWFGTKYLNRASKAKGSVLPSFQTRGAKATEKRTFGARSNLENLIALHEANLGRSGRTPKLADDIWASGALIGGLHQQNKSSRQRMGAIDKLLKGRLTAGDRSNLLSERAGLITSIESNKSRVADLKKDARDKLFELKQGKNNKTAIDYKKALADGTATLDDDFEAAKAEQSYWEARVAFLKKQHASKADITEAIGNLNTAKASVKDIMENIKRTSLGADAAQAALTPSLNDDLAAAKATEDWVQGMYDLAVATGDTAGIAKWGPELKSAKDEVDGIKENIALLGPQTAVAMASLTNDLNDDVTAAKGMVDYYQGLFDTADETHKAGAAQNLAGAKGDLASAKRNAELLPLERDQALAALTETLDDDKAATVKLRDYWQGQLDNAISTGDIQGQIEAAGNVKSLNDEIKSAEQTVAQQMVAYSQARADLYKAFASNAITLLPGGQAWPQASNNYARTVNVTNNFQQPPEDPHTWSAGVNWELQAAV